MAKPNDFLTYKVRGRARCPSRVRLGGAEREGFCKPKHAISLPRGKNAALRPTKTPASFHKLRCLSDREPVPSALDRPGSVRRIHGA
jgi:hypothetical protein